MVVKPFCSNFISFLVLLFESVENWKHLNWFPVLKSLILLLVSSKFLRILFGLFIDGKNSLVCLSRALLKQSLVSLIFF